MNVVDLAWDALRRGTNARSAVAALRCRAGRRRTALRNDVRLLAVSGRRGAALAPEVEEPFNGPGALLRTARSLFAHSWFDYEFMAVGCTVAFQALEAALRLVYPGEDKVPARALLKRIQTSGILPPNIVAVAESGFELRNRLSHPAEQSTFTRVALNGDEPGQVLGDEAVLVRRDHSHDLAAVLANRLEVRDRGSGPLPWLPPVPARLVADDFWHHYFDRRAQLIHRHGAAIRADASTWTEQSAPAWAVATLHEPDLTRDLAIWRAAHEVADTDLRPTGPPTPGPKDGHQQHRLDRRVSDAGAMPAKADARIAQLGESIHPGITADPHWPTLAQKLYLADHEGLSDTQLSRIATARPLPIDQPAAALAYRLVDALGERTPTKTTTALGDSEVNRWQDRAAHSAAPT